MTTPKEIKYYEVALTITKVVCVAAEDEDDAEAVAVDNAGGNYHTCEADIESELDPSKPEEAEYIKQYKQEGEFYK